MADYNGTDDDDIIDASELASDINRIYPGKGNDTITNATSGTQLFLVQGMIIYQVINLNMLLWYADAKSNY